MLITQKLWKEVSKSVPCPLCDRHDWCYSSENGEAIVCGRTEPNTAPMGWKYVKDAADGRAIFTVEKEKRTNMTVKTKNSQTSKKASNYRSKTLTLAKLPGTANDRPLPKPNQIPQ